MSLRLLDLNLWNVNEPFAARMAAFDAYVRTAQPDVLMLQEVSSPPGANLQLSAVPHLRHYRSAYQETGAWQARAEGIAILSLGSLEQVEAVRLPSGDDDMGRGALFCKVVNQRGAFGVITTHLAFRPAAVTLRCAQVEALIEFIARINSAYPELPIIVAGDLNDVPQSEPVRRLRSALSTHKSAFDLDNPPLTFSSSNSFVDPGHLPDRCIDYVFVPQDWEVTASRLVLDGSERASDHYGLEVSAER